MFADGHAAFGVIPGRPAKDARKAADGLGVFAGFHIGRSPNRVYDLPNENAGLSVRIEAALAGGGFVSNF